MKNKKSEENFTLFVAERKGAQKPYFSSTYNQYFSHIQTFCFSDFFLVGAPGAHRLLILFLLYISAVL